mgnify:CR=1 FL=1
MSAKGGKAPEPLSYVEGDMPGSIRVACASLGGEQVDGHFGSCPRFLVYQVSADEIRCIDLRATESADRAEDGSAYRTGLIEDCHLLYIHSIGGPAAARVVKAGVHPIKFREGGEAPELLTRLQKVLAGSPPPWLAKVMGATPEERIRYQRPEVP